MKKSNDPFAKLMAEGTAKTVSKLNQLQSEFKASKGKGTLSISSEFVAPDVLSTGVVELDQNVLAIGGIALGRCIEIAGETNAGKSTLSMNILREGIAAGLSCVIAENEGTFTEEYAAKIGMEPGTYHIFKGYTDKKGKDGKKSRHYLSGPQFLEEVLRLIEIGYDIVVVDSIFGIEGDSASEARLVDAKMGTKQSGAALMAQFAKLLKTGWTPFLDKNKRRKVMKYTDGGTTLILINHLKDKFGGFGKTTSGSVDITFLYSQRVWLERLGMSSDDLDENKNPIYTRVRVGCRKSKLSPGGRFTTLYLDNRDGHFVSDAKVLTEFAIKRGLIEKSGGWYNVNSEADISELPMLEEDQKWHGAIAFVEFCNEHKKLLKYILRF